MNIADCRSLLAVLTLSLAMAAHAEQKQRIGGFEAHYSLVPTTFLAPAVAAGYGITRARDRALLNIAVLDPRAGPVRAAVSGTVKDLLGTEREVAFEEVREGEAVYYLATLEHGDREVLRFAIDIRTPDGIDHRLTFQQTAYWGDP